VYELPAAAEVAREIIASAGLSDRVDVQVGDFQKEELGLGYDFVLLFGVLVSETTAGKEALLRKSHSALTPGGTVAIRSFLLDDERTGPGEAALFSLHMLLSTDDGDLTTESGLQRLLSEAGFVSAHPVSLPPWTGSTLYVAEKPAAA
jgi:cyclopropane fatty-acyl-phospholipid synthase-like methyltransferase